MQNVFKALAKCVLLPLGLTAAASATDVAIQKIFQFRNDYTNNTKGRNG